MTLQPIETRYAGCRFRSRLEARWAVFFDRLGIAWEYEPQGYNTAAGPYLPDFHLPAVRQWIEIKGGQPSADDVARCAAFAQELTDETYFVFTDLPRTPSFGDVGPLGIRVDRHLIYKMTGNTSHPMLGIVEGGDVPPDFHFFGHDIPDTADFLSGFVETWWLPWDHLAKLPGALKAARSARFEHGQVG